MTQPKSTGGAKMWLLLLISVLAAGTLASGTAALRSANVGTPIPAKDYQRMLQWGFDSDFFKSLDGMDGYSRRIMDDLATNSTVKTLRLRTRSDIFGFPDGTKKMDNKTMQQLIRSYNTILPDIFANGLMPVISWVNKPVVVKNPSLAVDGDNFVKWWSTVAEALKDQPFELAFNLFTEIAKGGLSNKPAVYNDWTKRAIKAIRASGGNNTQRVIILGAPKKEAKSLPNIDPSIYGGGASDFLLAEWHSYASGPSHKSGQKHWTGNGTTAERALVDGIFNLAASWSAKSEVATWVGAWMPYDNTAGTLSQSEVEAFACYFSFAAREHNVPWSMNSLSKFYDIANNKWIQFTSVQGVKLQMPSILHATTCTQPPGPPGPTPPPGPSPPGPSPPPGSGCLSALASVCKGSLAGEKTCTNCASLHKQELKQDGCADFDQDTKVGCKHATCVAGLDQYSCFTGSATTCERCFTAHKTDLKKEGCGKDCVAKLCDITGIYREGILPSSP